jgi:hypothetical protein
MTQPPSSLRHVPPKLATRTVALAALLTGALALAQTSAPASAPTTAPASQTADASPVVRLRGNLAAVSGASITMKTRDGETVELALAPDVAINEVHAIDLSEIRAGSFVGVGAVPQADGSQRAVAVTVFPESARGTGEGHRPFSLVPQGTMTNATVAEVAAAPQGRKLVVRYKDGEKTIVVAPGTPVSTYGPGDRTMLVPGASVVVSARSISGQPTAQRINVGRNGFELPY